MTSGKMQRVPKQGEDHKDQLRFIICGDHDTGKSTLIRHLLRESKLVSESRTETANLAYSVFETDKRKFFAAEISRHTPYTPDIATGAMPPDIAIVLIDASKGVGDETRRHSIIASMLSIRHIIFAVNKMDQISFNPKVFKAIEDECNEFATPLQLASIDTLPISALNGENIFAISENTGWFSGPTLMEHLETIQVDVLERPLRLPVQMANDAAQDSRRIRGTIAGGDVSVGDKIIAAVSGKSSALKQIVGQHGDLSTATVDQSITLILDDDIDVKKGDILSHLNNQPDVADQLAAHVIWMDQEPMLPERSYLARFGNVTVSAQITDLVHAIDVNTLDQHASKTLPLDGIGYCKIALDQSVAFDPYASSPATGSFVLIDKFTNATVGMGMIDFALRRATNIKWHEMKVDKTVRAKTNNQKPCVLWFTGLSGSGKSSIADVLEQKLHRMGKRTYLLDGDNVRHGLNKDLGFTDHDRVENIRRVAEVSKLMVDAGLIVITSFISPFRSERRMAREMMEDGEFLEVYINTPLEICEARDPKGLYKKARAGELKNFTGIDSEYEEPELAELTLQSAHKNPEELADEIIAYLSAQ